MDRGVFAEAVLVEVGFMNSDTDNKLFDENFNDIASAIADGIMDTLNVGTTGQTQPDTELRVQVGAFRNSVYAERLLRELTEQDFPAYIDDKGQFDRVQVGRYRTLDEAATMERRLKMAGYPTVIVSIPL